MTVVWVALPVVTASADSPAPAGSKPSQIARAICETKAITEIDDAVGLQARVSTPSWKDHLYSCAYRYKSGTIVLSVKELSSWDETYAYFGALAKSLHETSAIYELGQGAFRVRNGSVVVRKDWKVLFVNIAGLPKEFGSPKTISGYVALTVAGVILDCWHGD